MNVEIVNGDIIHEYLGILTTEEVLDCETEKITCFGAYDEETEDIMGILTAEIYPEFIVIKRIYVCPDYEGTGVENELLAHVTDIPDEIRLPIYIYGPEEDMDDELLTDCGFEALPSNYSYINGLLNDFIEINAALTDGELKTLDKIPSEELEKFVLQKDHDKLLQIPEGYLNTDRFSEGSLVLLKKHMIDGAILIEESDGFINIPYIYAEDNRLLLYAFFILKKLLLLEFTPGAKLRFLICNGIGREAITRLIRNSSEQKIAIYKYDV